MNHLLKGKMILIVDDDPRNIFALSAVLKAKGLKVFSASDGREAINRLKNNETEHIDLVLMDMMMPVMDGYDALREIKKTEALCHIPVIALTALAMVGDKERCLEAGADDYCPKPVDIDVLMAKMSAFFDV